jgi:hypothetical protein
MTVKASGWPWKVGLWLAGALMFAASLALFVILLPFGGLIALVPLAFTFLPWFRVGFVEASPEDLISFLADDFRRSSNVVAAGRSELTVRLDKWASVKIRARSEGKGSVLSYQIAATPNGWGALILLFLVVWPAPFAVIPTVVILHRVAITVEQRIANIVQKGRLPETFRRDDIHVLLLSSLGEGQRLALESYEAERDRYHDTVGVVALLAILGWFLSFLALGALLPQPDWGRRMVEAFLLSSAGALLFGILAGVFVRARFRPAILSLRDWVSRLEAALRQEASPEPVEAVRPSTFDLLWRTSAQVPGWIATQGRAGLSRDPGMWGILFIAIWGGVNLVTTGIPLLLFPVLGAPLAGIGLVAAGVALCVGAERLYSRWRRKREEELARAQDGWNRQYAALRTGMEKFLQDL